MAVTIINVILKPINDDCILLAVRLKDDGDYVYVGRKLTTARMAVSLYNRVRQATHLNGEHWLPMHDSSGEEMTLEEWAQS
ncbi:MAG: hypothetical protein ACQ5SW_07755 [Sphaerochaetaceae bacterium]